MKLRVVACIAFLALSLAAACGGNAAPPQVPVPRETLPTTSTTPPIDGAVRAVGHEFWHSGFHVALIEAEVWTSKTLMTNRVSHWLRISGTFDNQGDELAAFEPEMAIVADGESYSITQGDPPWIRPGEPALGTITFLIPEDLDLETAEFVVGSPDEAQARIPLGVQGALVTLRPTVVELDAVAATPMATFHLASATLRHDVPFEHRQAESGSRFLTITVDVANRTESWGFDPDDVTLLLADGTEVAATSTESVTVPAGTEDAATTSLDVSFMIGEATDQFDLRIRLDPALVEEDDDAVLTFSIEL